METWTWPSPIQGSNSVSVFRGDGNGGFAQPITVPTGQSPTRVLVGDFNHDGKADLATMDIRGQTVTILLGNGDGTFQQVGQIPVRDTLGGVVGDCRCRPSAAAQGALRPLRHARLLQHQGPDGGGAADHLLPPGARPG